MQLHEQFRPKRWEKRWEEVIGQDKAVQKIRTVAHRGLAGRAW